MRLRKTTPEPKRTQNYWRLLASGFIVLMGMLLVPFHVWAIGVLEIPPGGSTQSGQGLVAGWWCDAERIEGQFDANARFQIPYGSDRDDTMGACGDDDNGFVSQVPYSELPDGEHTLQVFAIAADDTETKIGEVTFTVVRFNGDNFLTDASGMFILNGFPDPDNDVKVMWDEASQNFVIVDTDADGCPSDMTEVGAFCVDKFEASVWSSADGTGAQYGAVGDNYPCSDNGNDCEGQIFAVSRTGESPAQYITWFQAQQACANVNKRLLTNAEWQGAAAGTPDMGVTPGAEDCNTASAGTSLTGTRENCVSAWGAYDTTGNVWEWVADWIQDNDDIDDGTASTATYGEDGIFGVDEAEPTADRFPAALVRGGSFTEGTAAGVFTLVATVGPSFSEETVGFRCGRPK